MEGEELTDDEFSYQQEPLPEDSKFLSWLVVNTENNEQLVTPWFKVRKMKSWEDLKLSASEIFFNKTNWKHVLQYSIMFFASILVWWNFRYYFLYFMAGLIIGNNIGIIQGKLLQLKDLVAVTVQMTKGKKTYVSTEIDPKITVPKIQYVQADFDFFAIKKIPRALVNEMKEGRPTSRGFYMQYCKKRTVNGKDYYWAEWMDESGHVYIGGTMTLTSFLLAIATMDKDIIRTSRRYEKKLKKYRKIVEKNSVEVSPGVIEIRNQDNEKVQDAMAFMEFDKQLKTKLDELMAISNKIEEMAGVSPLKTDLQRTDKYVKRVLVAVSTYNAQIELNKKRLEEKKDAHGVYLQQMNEMDQFIKSAEFMPTVYWKMKQSILSNIISVVDEQFGYGPETLREAGRRLSKRLEHMIEEAKPQDEKTTAMVVSHE